MAYQTRSSNTPVADLIQQGEIVTYNNLRDRMIEQGVDLRPFTLYEELKAEVEAGYIKERKRGVRIVYQRITRK